MLQDFTASVLRNVDQGHGSFLLEFELPGDAAAAMQPAQFFMIGIPGSAPLLRRPFSVCGLPGTFEQGGPRAVQVLYKVFGRGTALLAALAPGAPIRVLGPLGRGFRPPARRETQPLFVAGGIGAAPFPALWHRLAADHPAPRMIYGARHAADLPLVDWFETHCAELIVTTDDGSRGRRGLVTAPLEELLAASAPGSLQLYACGPEPMLRAVARVATARGVACQLSLEAHMACGFGVCLGCVVPVRREGGAVGYDRVCVEGPVMDAEVLAW